MKKTTLNDLESWIRAHNGISPESEDSSTTICYSWRRSAGDDEPSACSRQAAMDLRKDVYSQFPDVVGSYEAIDEWANMTFRVIAGTRSTKPDWPHQKVREFLTDTVVPVLAPLYIKCPVEYPSTGALPYIRAFYDKEWDQYVGLEMFLSGTVETGYEGNMKFGRFSVKHKASPTGRGLMATLWKKLQTVCGACLNDAGRLRWALKAVDEHGHTWWFNNRQQQWERVYLERANIDKDCDIASWALWDSPKDAVPVFSKGADWRFRDRPDLRSGLQVMWQTPRGPLRVCEDLKWDEKIFGNIV